MSELVWGTTGHKIFETGVSNGVLYPMDGTGAYPLGIVWNGLISVTQSPSGAESNKSYADNTVYANILSNEEFSGTIEAFTYPDEFAACDGSAALAIGVSIGQQARSSFGLVYKTKLGNDVLGVDYGYKLHIIYGGLASPSERAYQTINDSPEPNAFSWEVTSTPVSVTSLRPTSELTLDSTKADAVLLAALEVILFGAPGVDPRLPLPNEIKTLFDGAAPSALALSSIVPNDDAAGVAVDANVVFTFNNAVVDEAITLATNAGVIIAGTKTWDTARKILTFNPTSNFAGATVVIITIAGVTDIYGQALASAVKNFTVV